MVSEITPIQKIRQFITDVKFAFRRNFLYGQFWQVYQVYGVTDNVYRFVGKNKTRLIGKVGFMEVDDKKLEKYVKQIKMAYDKYGNLLVVRSSHGYHFITFSILNKEEFEEWLKIWDGINTNYICRWDRKNVLRISPKQEPIQRYAFLINEGKLKKPLSLGHLAVYKLTKCITNEEMERLEKYALVTRVNPIRYCTKGEI